MKFEIEFCLLSDYASQTFDGKIVIGGAYPSEITFIDEPQVWPSFFVTVCLRSLEPRYDFAVDLQAPTGVRLFSLTGQHVAEAVTDSARVLLQGQIPPQPFSGPGVYKIVAYDPSGETRSEKSFVVRIGSMVQDRPVVVAQMLAGPLEAKGSETKRGRRKKEGA